MSKDHLIIIAIVLTLQESYKIIRPSPASHITVNQYCLPSPCWIQPILAADGVFTFTRLYFETGYRR